MGDSYRIVDDRLGTIQKVVVVDCDIVGALPRRCNSRLHYSFCKGTPQMVEATGPKILGSQAFLIDLQTCNLRT